MPNILSKGKRKYLLDAFSLAAERAAADERLARYIVSINPKITISQARKNIAEKNKSLGRIKVSNADKHAFLGNPALWP
ncbi:hypothetical protein MZD04_gp024 [Pseudomonas phage Psa21]|uniref:Uncharacterized protein n=1 Tax=Pseudomonas phage Psa21 TaxID=2530023 RepID=A0A481W590_9CAUD|nr:hypothetical protein MZD04_gp024 [Pseudomonas phage Psa21]QBJ02554.1 hypothetical protein PSA21_24 [Pseudomonas phage Psa21]